MTRRSRFPGGSSIEVRLPFFIALVLLLVMAGFSVAVYRQTRSSLVELTATRLEAAAGRLEELLARSNRQQQAGLGELAEHPALRRFLAGQGGAGAARDVLDSLVSASESRVGMRVRGGDTAVASGAVPSDAAPEDVGAFFRAEGRLRYTVSAATTGGGRIEDVRQLSAEPDAGQALAGLIGADARFLVGNADGSLWLDLARERPGPRGPLPEGELVWRDTEDGRRIGMAASVDGTPWMVWVDFPEGVITGPLAGVLRGLAGVTTLLLVAGALFGWWLSRRITKPLKRLTVAAEGIARGDYGRRIGSERSDEIGRLAGAFDTMAEEVQQSQEGLEQRVAARTAELERALAELESAQEELVRKERLALLGELAGGVGHELRNPLGVMTNAVFYLEAVLTDPSADVEDYLAMLRHQIHLSEKIVADLLDFARVKPPQTRPVALPDLVAAQVERAAPGPGVDVSYDFEPDLPAVLVDPDQVGQVVLNLVTNAAQAVEAGGAIRIRGSRSPRGVRLDVQDTGPGIPAEARDKIFEPLFTTKARGIGLGLSVSRTLTAANGGALSVQSEPGQGATFTLVLPSAPARVPA